MFHFWSEPALADLDAIHSYIAADSAIYADAVNILAVLHGARDFPAQAV